MTLRSRHGNARNFGTAPVLETMPVDELPDGTPDDGRPDARAGRGERGRFVAGNPHAAEGGKRKAGKTKLATKLGLAGELPEDNVLRAYKASAETFRRVTTGHLAATVGGGSCGPAPSSFVATGSLALGWSRYFFDAAALVAGDPTKAAKLVDLGMKLGEASSSLLRQAHEYTAKEAEARAKATGPVDALARWRER